MKIERMCHVSSINLTFSVHPTIDNIQSKTNIQSTFYSVPLNQAKCFSPTHESFLYNQQGVSLNETPPNIASYHAYFTYLYPKTRSFMHILAVFYAVFFLLEWIQTIFFQ